MKLIQADREKLLKPLQAVAGIVERKHTLPILSNVLLEGSGDTLSLTATDLEIQIGATARDLAMQQDFAITVSARKLLDICRALPETKITLELDDSRLVLRGGKSRFSLQTLPAADFPRLSLAAAQEGKIRMSQKEFRQLLHLAQFAMAQQDIRYYLNGLLLVLEDRQIKLVATDGHRLSFASAELEQAQEKRSEVILPRKTVLELVKLLSDSDDAIEIELGQNQAHFAFSGINLVTKVVDGKFPDYNRVIPLNNKKIARIDRASLHQAMQRAAILSNEKFRGVRLVLTHGGLSIICNNSEQEEAQEDLEIAYADEPLDIGFNVSYLLDVLNNVDSSEVECAFSDANSSCLITLPGKDNFRYVVMPMRI